MNCSEKPIVHELIQKIVTFCLILTIGIIHIGCTSTKPIISYESDTVKIQKITEGVYLHTSYLNTQSFGKVPCNGMIVVNDDDAIIFDTPVDNIGSVELINWVEGELGAKIKNVVATHFHVDCLGGLQEFQKRGIPSYAHNTTIQLARVEGSTIPENGFNNAIELSLGKEKVICRFLGEGHTKDNIISYFPSKKALFGGCLIKSDGAGKGNLADANVQEWPLTVQLVKSEYADAEIIIPGHGQFGGQELLDYTIALFEKN